MCKMRNPNGHLEHQGIGKISTRGIRVFIFLTLYATPCNQRTDVLAKLGSRLKILHLCICFCLSCMDNNTDTGKGYGNFRKINKSTTRLGYGNFRKNKGTTRLGYGN